MDQKQIDTMITTGDPTLDLTKHDKIRYKVFNKVRIMFLNTINELNFHDVVIRVMREINKESSLYGFDKKRLALEIMSLLLQEFGVPSVVSVWTVESISIIIESIYVKGYHRKKNRCILM